MRRYHVLSYNRGSQLPSTLAFVDTETRPVDRPDGYIENRMWLATVISHRLRSGPHDERGYRVYEGLRTPDEVWDVLESLARPKSRLLAYAHNWAFDFPVLGGFEAVHSRGWTVQSAVLDAPPFILMLRRGDRALALVDTMNYFPISLRKIGDGVGLPKLPMPSPDAPESDWLAYCRRDVEVLHRAIIGWLQLVDDQDMGGAGLTIAQQAWNYYRHRHYHHPIHIHDDDEVLWMERQAYYGGRVECWRIGRVAGPIYVVDVNSLYPSVMRAHDYPCRLRAKGVGLDSLQRAVDGAYHTALAHVCLETDVPMYPRREGRRLIFPVGRYWTWLPGPELEQAMRLGHVRDVAEWSAYDTAPLFTAYVDTLWEMRRDYQAKGDEYKARICKLLMNSLYGKFGQRGYRWVVWRDAWEGDPPYWVEDDYEEERVVQYRRVGDVVQRLDRTDEWRDSYPAIAAWVTSRGRVKMWQHIMQAGPDHVHYIDTDSLFLDSAGYSRLVPDIDPTALGKFKLERVATAGTIYAPKDYRLDHVVRLKGVRANAVEVAPGVYQQEEMVNMSGMLRQGDTSTQRSRMVIKRLRREYLKGQVVEDGRVHPWVLSEP